MHFNGFRVVQPIAYLPAETFDMTTIIDGDHDRSDMASGRALFRRQTAGSLSFSLSSSRCS